MAIAKGVARIKHAETGAVYEIDARSIHLETVGFEDREMGPEYMHEATVSHPVLGDLLWQVWEYPIGTEDDRETQVDPHTLLNDVDIEFFDEDEDGPGSPSDEDRQQRIEAMVDWFFENFEDPVHQLPYVSAEGGYQWVFGGPYNASTELQENFPDEDLELVEAAVSKIEADGTLDWAEIQKPEYADEEDSPNAQETARPSESSPEEIEALEELIRAIPVPRQDPLFEVQGDGRVHLARPPDAATSPIRDPDHDDPLKEELALAVNDLASSLIGTNAHTDIQATIEYYRSALLDDELSISRLYCRGVRLENANAALRIEIERGHLPPLPEQASGLLTSTLDLHATYIMRTAEGRELAAAAAQYRRPANENANFIESANRIGLAVSNAPHLFEPEVQDLVAKAARDAGSGPAPERSNQVATRTVGGLALTLLKWVGVTGAAALLSSAIGASASISAVAVSAGGGIDAAVSFITSHATDFRVVLAAAGADLGWAEPVFRVLNRIARSEHQKDRDF